HAGHAGLVARKEAAKRIRGHDEIDDRHHDQDDAEQGQDELHGSGPPQINTHHLVAVWSRPGKWYWRRHTNQIRPRLLMVAARSPTVHRMEWQGNRSGPCSSVVQCPCTAGTSRPCHPSSKAPCLRNSCTS